MAGMGFNSNLAAADLAILSSRYISSPSLQMYIDNKDIGTSPYRPVQR
jgi:hypothetical protein